MVCFLVVVLVACAFGGKLSRTLVNEGNVLGTVSDTTPVLIQKDTSFPTIGFLTKAVFYSRVPCAWMVPPQAIMCAEVGAVELESTSFTCREGGGVTPWKTASSDPRPDWGLL